MSANALEIINGLERLGYTLTVANGKVRGDRQDTLPPPPESAALLDMLRQHKGEVMDALMNRAWTSVPPTEGDAYQVTFDGGDEGQRARWRVAVQAGLIHLTDKVQASRKSGQCRIAFRAATPLDWLQEDIAATCKERYNAVLGRIHAGEEWLRTHPDDPQYDRCLNAYAALFDELRELYNAIGESLEDPFMGYSTILN